MLDRMFLVFNRTFLTSFEVGKSGYVLEIMTAKQFASDIDNMLERYSKEKDFTKENFLKKSMLEVSVEKLQTLYNPVATHSNSYAVVSLRILRKMPPTSI